jgi:hypothetical protein
LRMPSARLFLVEFSISIRALVSGSQAIVPLAIEVRRDTTGKTQSISPSNCDSYYISQAGTNPIEDALSHFEVP